MQLKSYKLDPETQALNIKKAHWGKTLHDQYASQKKRCDVHK